MPRNVLRISAIALLFAAPALFANGPADLLDQAIKENEGAGRADDRTARNSEIHRLADEAERLVAAEEFAKAVALYEKAYRLDPDNRAMYARLLVAKRSAGTMTEQDREALSIIEEEQAAELGQVYRRVRLQIIQAKQAIRTGDLTLAQERIASADTELAGVPRNIDVSPYQRQLTALRNSMKRGRPRREILRSNIGQGRRLDGHRHAQNRRGDRSHAHGHGRGNHRVVLDDDGKVRRSEQLRIRGKRRNHRHRRRPLRRIRHSRL
ncbi:MAG: hypothetical protein IPK83_12955 [Planctomycetes bacterium]|nr:hypothetical protein [Planctomycetota bacterium]